MLAAKLAVGLLLRFLCHYQIIRSDARFVGAPFRRTDPAISSTDDEANAGPFQIVMSRGGRKLVPLRRPL